MTPFVNYYDLYTKEEENKTPQTFSEKVLKVLQLHDPASFKELYLPDDEYGIEATVIINRLRNVESIGILRSVIYEVFEEYLGRDTILPSVDKCYKQIAQEVWDIWQKEIINANNKRV